MRPNWLRRKDCIQLTYYKFDIVFRWIRSRTFKDDINNDYGIYPDSGEVVMEVIDRNAEYEHATVGGQDANKQQVFYDYENWEDEYDKMYEDHAGEQGKQ